MILEGYELDEIIDDIILATEGDLDEMDKLITGGKDNNEPTSNK